LNRNTQARRFVWVFSGGNKWIEKWARESRLPQYDGHHKLAVKTVMNIRTYIARMDGRHSDILLLESSLKTIAWHHLQQQ